MSTHSKILCAVEQHATYHPNKIAFYVGEQEISYALLLERVRQTAYIMRQFGLQVGDKIILSAHKEAEFIYVYLASHLLGVINVVIDAETNEERLLYIEDKIKPQYCFGYKSSRFPSKLFSELDWENTAFSVIESPQISAENTAEILFTTGTTGLPKGVCLSYNNIYSSANNINRFIGNTANDVELLCLPICHSFGLGRIRCNLLMGASVVLLGSFANMRVVLNSFEKYHVTGFGVVPAAWAYIRKISGRRLEKYASQIRYIEIGSSAMPIDTKRELLSMFPNTRICMHYGLTEASRSTFLEFHDSENLHTIGKAVVPEVSVKIMDKNGKELEAGVVGEICVSGNMVMNHYLDASDNDTAFYDDYFRTGDMGYKNEDGYIVLIGREKEIINVGGKKVSPAEVEDVICSLGVGDCVCVPITDNRGIFGEVVKCYVLRNSTSLTFEEISDALADKLEPYKRPVEYEWIDVIPTTESGKKQRLKIK